MSLILYCIQCAERMEYTDMKPLFCQSCGTPLCAEAKAKLLQKQSAPPRQITPAKKITPILEDNRTGDRSSGKSS